MKKKIISILLLSLMEFTTYAQDTVCVSQSGILIESLKQKGLNDILKLTIGDVDSSDFSYINASEYVRRTPDLSKACIEWKKTNFNADDEDQLFLNCYEIFFTDIDKHPVIVDIVDTEIIFEIIGDMMGDSIETGGYFSLDNSNPMVASAVLGELEDLDVIITPLRAGKTIITVTHKKTGKRAEIQVTVVALCPDDNHPHAIDLGLPSGTKWACCNVGAHSPEEYGGYYSWGETEEKEDYCWNNYQFAYLDSSDDGYWDTTQDTGYWHCHSIGSDISGTEYDVAHVKWGGSWQMPTLTQVHELLNYCGDFWCWNFEENYDWYSSSSGQNIIFPHGGYRSSSKHIKRGGYYWLSTEASDYPTFNHDYTAACIIFDGGNAWGAWNRLVGNNVRPVINSTNDLVVSTPSAQESNQAIYNLYGIKVADNVTDLNTLPPGIYIVNGKKMVIR